MVAVTSRRTSGADQGGAGRGRPALKVDRSRLYGRAALFAVAVGFVFTVLAGSGSGTASGRLGGDFPAFYAAGSLVADGAWESLYDPQVQSEAQAALFADDTSGDYLYFAYPPPVAALYRPLAALDYRMAYALHSIVMTGLLIGALALARPLVPLLRTGFEAAVTVSLLFYPMLRSVTGGQNTSMTLFLLVLVWRGLAPGNSGFDAGAARSEIRRGDADRTWKSEAVAGLGIAALFYKPQFALPLLGLVVWRRRWTTALTASAGVLTLWVLSAAWMGAGWLGPWWTRVSEFSSRDAEVNSHNAISFLGVAEASLGAGSVAARYIAAPFVVAVVAFLLWLWRPGRPTMGVPVFAATAAGLVAISPHAMFYDAGLFVIIGIVMADFGRASWRPLLAACWILSWGQVAAARLGLSPLFVVSVVACGSAAWVNLSKRGPCRRDPRPASA